MICKPCRHLRHDQCGGQRHYSYCDCQHVRSKQPAISPGGVPIRVLDMFLSDFLDLEHHDIPMDAIERGLASALTAYHDLGKHS